MRSHLRGTKNQSRSPVRFAPKSNPRRWRRHPHFSASIRAARAAVGLRAPPSMEDRRPAEISSVRCDTGFLPSARLAKADMGGLEDRDSAHHVAPLDCQLPQFVTSLGPEHLSTPNKLSLDEIELCEGCWHS